MLPAGRAIVRQQHGESSLLQEHSFDCGDARVILHHEHGKPDNWRIGGIRERLGMVARVVGVVRVSGGIVRRPVCEQGM